MVKTSDWIKYIEKKRLLRGEPKMVSDFEQCMCEEIIKIRKALQALVELVSMKVEGR